MFDQILFPTDGSDGAARAFDHALEIAASHEATVHVLYVADTTQDSVVRIRGEVVDVLEGEGEEIVEEAADRARKRGVEAVTEVLQGQPYETIVDYANDRGVDLVVMPTHGRRGLQRLLLGSTTERVVRRADVPVLTLRPDEDAVRYPYRNVLVPTDGSDGADEALSLATGLTTDEGADLHVLTVVSVGGLGVDGRADLEIEMLEESAEEIVDRATGTANSAGVDSVTGAVKYGDSVPTTILEYVEENDVDLLVVGTHGRTGLDRYLLGSVTESLVRTAPVPVLTVRKPADSD